MLSWCRRCGRRKPLVLYVVAIFLLYPMLQSLHLVKLYTLDHPMDHMGSDINLRDYFNSTTAQVSNPDDAGALSIKELSGELLEELRQIHRELMDVLRSPLTTNKTEAHNLNTQVLLMIKKLNHSDTTLQGNSAKLGAMVAVKDIVYKEMRLIRKLTEASKQGAGVQGKPHPQPARVVRPPTRVRAPKPPVKEEKHCLKLKYVKPPMAVTALASYPGSGNTWLRHLIQEATGLMTGSLHADPYLTRAGFPGERTTDGKVVVVKAHSQPDSLKGCSKAIVLLRNPYKSLLADFNRHNRVSSNEHIGHAPDNLFTEPDWTRRANTLGADWYMFYDGWLEYKKPLLVLTYEDLKANPKYHVKRIVQFLGLNIPEKNYECMLNNTEGSYHRKPKQVEVNLFNQRQVDLVNLYSDMVNDKVRRYNVTVDTSVPH